MWKKKRMIRVEIKLKVKHDDDNDRSYFVFVASSYKEGELYPNTPQEAIELNLEDFAASH